LPERDEIEMNRNDIEFKEIKELLFEQNKQIVAMKGSEKTTYLANKLSFEFALVPTNYVYWFNAFDLNRELKIFMDMIKITDNEKKFEKDNLIKEIYKHFERIENKNTRVIFIVDGIKEKEDFEMFIADKLPNAFRILFTSRIVNFNLKELNETIIEKDIEQPQKKSLLSIGDEKFRIINNLKSTKFEEAYLAEEQSENDKEKYES
jgi:hypothetical protein